MPAKSRSSKSPKPKSRTKTVKKRAIPVARKKAPAARLSKQDKLASNALKFIDQAADILRKGVVASASESAHVHQTARKKAHTLLEKAHTSLGEALDAGTSALHKMLGKI